MHVPEELVLTFWTMTNPCTRMGIPLTESAIDNHGYPNYYSNACKAQTYTRNNCQKVDCGRSYVSTFD